MLFVILAEVELEVVIPVRDSPGLVEVLTALLTLRLFAVVVLPTRFEEIVLVPAVTWMPMRLLRTLAVEPAVVIEPTVLFEMSIVFKEPDVIPNILPSLFDVVTVIEPVPDALPTVFPAVVPISTFPDDAYIPLNTPEPDGEVLFVVNERLATVLF